MRTKGQYRITYENGVTQIKNLIKHSDFETVIKPKQKRIYELEVMKKDNIASILKANIRNCFGEEWFTDASPMFNAIKSGFLSLPKTQGGKHKCQLIKI